MGTSTNGILAYGYDLGEDFGFDYETPEPAWYDEDHGWESSAVAALLAAVGIDYAIDDYMSDDDLLKATGVCFETYCSDRSPMYLLVACKPQTAHRGDANPINALVPEGADERLAWALGVLGIKPTAEQPQWLLASYWG